MTDQHNMSKTAIWNTYVYI